jgi:hypothetical protein
MPYVSDELRPDFGKAPLYPPAARVAGIVWLASGGLYLISVVAFAVWLSVEGVSGDLFARNYGPVLFFFVGTGGGLLGAAYLTFGVWSVRGTAHDTLGPGLASIFFGLLPLIAHIYFFLLFGTGPVVAGVLALVGRSKYMAWRRAQRGRRATSA